MGLGYLHACMHAGQGYLPCMAVHAGQGRQGMQCHRAPCMPPGCANMHAQEHGTACLHWVPPPQVSLYVFIVNE